MAYSTILCLDRSIAFEENCKKEFRLAAMALHLLHHMQLATASRISGIS